MRKAICGLLGAAALATHASAQTFWYSAPQVPILDRNGQPVSVDGTPIVSTVCIIWFGRGETIEHQVLSKTGWLQAVSFEVDTGSRKVTVTHIWSPNVLDTPETVPLGGTGYIMAGGSSQIEYDVSYTAPLVSSPPQADCNWRQLVASAQRNYSSQLQVIEAQSGGEGPWLPPQACFNPVNGHCVGNLPRGMNCWTEYQHNGLQTTTIRHCL